MTHHIDEIDKKGLREFGLLTGSIVALLFGLLLPWLFNKPFPLWPWYVLGGLGGLAIVLPMSLRPIYQIWMRFGAVMGWINTRIILGAIFYILFTPIAIILKVMGKDMLKRKLDNRLQSYRVESKRSPREQMEKPF